SMARKFHFRPRTSDEGVMAQVFRHNDYDFARLRRGNELKQLYDKQIASGRSPLIIDAGANIGASAVHFACSFPKARIVAIESEKANYDLLLANTRDLAVDHMLAALASSASMVELVDPGLGSWAFRTATTGPGKSINQHVQCVTVNDIYAARAHDAVPFVAKID